MNPIAMTLLLVAGWGLFAYSAARRWTLLNVGQPTNRLDRIPERIRNTIDYAFKQRRMPRYPLAGLAHMLIFLGFGVLLLRTLILWGRGFDPGFNLLLFGPDQALGKLYGLLKDIFAVLVLIGAAIFIYFRVIRKLGRLTLNTEGLIILGIIVTMMIADITYDGAAMARASAGFHYWEPAGSIAALILSPLPDGLLTFLAHAGFWTHSALVLIFLNLLPYSKHFHIITGIPNVFLASLDPPGRLPPVPDIEGKLEREETLGIRRIDQFSWKSILDFYTCTECGRCSDHCPATRTGKKLSPKHFTIDLRNFLYANADLLTGRNGAAGRTSSAPDAAQVAAPASDGSPDASSVTAAGEQVARPATGDLVPGIIDPEVLWACTSCRACEQECPVFITYVDKIVDMRRHLVMEKSEFPAQLQNAFQGIERSGNPWSFPAEDRAKWAEGLDVPLLAEKPDAEVLLWVGCAPSYDDRAKKVSRATAQLLQKAGVNFAILGPEETCTGDPARRAGNEFLFQMFAEQNVETLNNHEAGKKKIVTSCPHCFNTLKNEYPDFGGKFDVVHHSTLLAELMQQGRLKPARRLDQKVVFHDSCYLGRYNDVYDPPRDVLRNIGLTVLEPAATRDRGMCCGAGGAQMFKEEEPGRERVNIARTEQLLDTRPDIVSSGCPFCMRMLTDGLASKHREEVPQKDVAELLWEAVEGTPGRPV